MVGAPGFEPAASYDVPRCGALDDLAVPTAIWGTSDKLLVIAAWYGAILRRTQ
jgi:hypothetical protein